MSAASLVGLPVSGAELSATLVSISGSSFSSTPVAGDLLLFVYGTQFKAFGNPDWLPNSGWTAIESSSSNGISGFIGALYHIVQTGETSWSPCNDAGNSVAGAYICYLIRGHAIANPVLQTFHSNTSQADLYPNVGAGAPTALGLSFAWCVFSPSTGSVALSGGVAGGESWSSDNVADGTGALYVYHVPFIDNSTPSTGTFGDGTNNGVFQQLVIQASPEGFDDNVYMEMLEVVDSDFAPTSGDISFTLSFTPSDGHRLFVLAVGSVFMSPPPTVTGWDVLLTSSPVGVWAATRVWHTGDPLTYDLGGAGSSFYLLVYELKDVQFQGSASGSETGPTFTSPSVISDVGPTLCFIAASSGTDTTNTYPGASYGTGQLPDTTGAWSHNDGGVDDKFCAGVSHIITRAGGDGTTTLAGAPGGSDAECATVVFSLGPVPCPVTPPASTLGDLSPKTVPEARLTVYNAFGTVEQIEVRDDLIGGQIQYEDTPSGCGACTLNLGIFWEDMVAPEGSISNAYWIARNIVEISSYDDVIQDDILAGANKIYVGSRKGYDPAWGNVETQQIILDDGVNVTYRIPVTGVGTDGGGDYITVGPPGSYPSSPPEIPAYAAGTKIFRRRYTGLIMRRGLWNSRQPQGQITLTGLAQYLNEAVGTFTINIEEVGAALYDCVSQFASRWPQLVIDEANFPYTAQAYSGSNQQYTLADEITQILSCGITNGDTWVIRVGHDWTVRLLRLFSQSCDAYDYVVTLRQGVKHYEAQFVQGQDEDVSNFYNSIEVTGDTNSATKQPFGAIVQDAESITLFGQVDGVPISNTSCKSDDDCALYAQALLNDNAIPRNNFQVRVFTYTDATPDGAGVATPMGLTRGDAILGVHDILIQDFEGSAPNIQGLCMSVVTMMDIKNCDSWQDAKFAQIEPNWNRAVRERSGKLAITLRHNTLVPVSVDSYMVGPFADQVSFSPTSLSVKIGGTEGFQAVFGYGTGIQTIPQTTLTLTASTTNYVFLDAAGAFHIQAGNPIPADDSWMQHSHFQTSATGVVGYTFKAPKGVLNNGSGGGGGGGGVLSIDGIAGAVVLNEGAGIEIDDGSPAAQDITLKLAPIADGDLLANKSGSSAAPVAVALSDLLDYVIGNTRGALLERGSGGWTKLVPGTSGYVLTSGGPGADPTYQPSSSLSPIPDGDLLANESGSSGLPTGVSLSSLLDYVLGSTRGAVLERGASGWQIISPGTSGYVFTSNGPGADPTWSPASGASTGSCTESQTAATTTATRLLASNSSRVGVSITNTSGATLFIGSDNTTSSTKFFARVNPNGAVDLPNAYTGEVWGIWDSAPGTPPAGNANVAAFPS